MVDFRKLRASGPAAAPMDPIEIFKRLPKPPHINDLWATQSQALHGWHARRAENDIVLKLNTGGGKTLVGLLIAQSLINEIRQPALYLCANNQLAEQTLQKAGEIGISALRYAPGEDLPPGFLNAESILIASYQALFHGYSRFGVAGSGKEPKKVGSIVLDDAHTAFAIVRQQFSITVAKKDFKDLYADLTMRFRPDFEAIGKVGTYDDIVERGDQSILEVPYWGWRSKSEPIRKLLASDYAEDFAYELPLLRDSFDSCQALVSARDFTITPILPLVHLFPAFTECKRRVYMSATIADDSSIVRTLDADAKAVGAPIVPESLAGVGERMILAPALMPRLKEPVSIVKAIAGAVAKKGGVVILVPSEKAAEEWKDVAEYASGEAVAKAVRRLVKGESKGPFVFPNRYDGIDLPGDACRLLILHSLPRGANTYDLYRAATLRENSSINVTLAQRIEQGLGRGTRGAGDYCVVLLSGQDLLAWISQKANLNLMTPSTRTQILLGDEITKAIASRSELTSTINQCLGRDREWTKYHAETLADRTEAPSPQTEAIRAAVAERKFLRLFVSKDYEKAIAASKEYAESAGVEPRFKGWMLHLAARAAFCWGKVSVSEELHKKAFSANPNLPPPKTVTPYETIQRVEGQVKNIVSLVQAYDLKRGCLSEFDETVCWLTTAATSNQFEEGLKSLAKFLGFHGQRPEHNFKVGPDVLWLVEDEFGFVIECKSKKDPKNPLTKEEHGQLLTAEEWFRREYPKRKSVRLVVHPNANATEPAAADKSYALTIAKLNELIASVREVLSELCASEAEAQELEKRCAAALKEKGLTPSSMIAGFLKVFEVPPGAKRK